MIEVILVPLDGSALAEATLPYALAVQRAFSSRLLLLRVVGDAEGSGDSVEWRLSRAEAHSYLEGIAEELREEGCEAEPMVTAGKPSEAILETAREREADLVLLSSHGAGGPSPFEVSGTAHKVLSTGATSVLLVRVAQGARPSRNAELETILVPVDGSARSDWALCLATSIARSSGAELLLLRVLPRPEGLLPGSDEREVDRLLEASRRTAEERMAARVRQVKAPDLEIRTRVVVASSVPRTIDDVATREKASLTVLSAHGSTADERWPYGSVSGALLRNGSSPVLIFQDAPRMETNGHRLRQSRWSGPRTDTVWTG